MIGSGVTSSRANSRYSRNPREVSATQYWANARVSAIGWLRVVAINEVEVEIEIDAEVELEVDVVPQPVQSRSVATEATCASFVKTIDLILGTNTYQFRT